eukprot:Em0006g222a
MCSVSSIGNVFLGDFVQFHIVGILAIGHIVQFVCQEGIEDISVKVQLLSKHPDAEKPDCYILGDMYSIFSRNILQVLPNAALWISGLYRQTENEAILQELTVQTNSSTGLDNIAEYRTKAQTLQHIQSIQQCLTETEKKHVRNLYGITEVENALLQLDVDLHRCTPLEALHVFLLGIYKYFLRDFMGRLSKREKNEIAGRIAAFNFSGFSHRLSRDITRYYRSFVGRDFKVLAQLSLFIFAPYLTASETEVWFGLSKLFKLVYCDKLYLEMINEYRDACCSFVQTVQRNCPGHRKKPKLHLLMHLPEYIELFGHPSSYNTERCETYNSLIRSQNVYGNKMAPSKDIAHSFAVLNSIYFTFSGGIINSESTSAIKLKDVKIQLCSGCISISEATNFSCLFSTHEIDYNTSVLQCNAVESDDGQLINVGTFVQLKLQRTTSNEVIIFHVCYQLGAVMNDPVTLTEISLVPIYHDQACRNRIEMDFIHYIDGVIQVVSGQLNSSLVQAIARKGQNNPDVLGSEQVVNTPGTG